MSLEVVQVAAEFARDRVVDLLFTHHHWPVEDRRDYLTLWQWRYHALGDGKPLVWVAKRRGQDSLVGHLALFPRNYRVGNQVVRVLVPGDILVHRDARGMGLGRRLLGCAFQELAEHRADALLMFGTTAGHNLHLQHGAKDLGPLHSYVDIVRVRSLLSRRARPLTPLGWMADALLERRRLARNPLRKLSQQLRAQCIGAEALAGPARAHWTYRGDRVVSADSAGYIERRFLQDPSNRRQVIGLVDRGTTRLEGYTIFALGAARATVCDCQTNSAVLDVPTAILLASRELPPHIDLCHVPTVSGSLLGNDLTRAGFFHRAPEQPPPAYVSAVALADSAAGPALTRIESWHVFSGAADA